MKRYIAGIGLCCALAACNESYPGLYAPVYDADNPNPEMTADSIPVTLSLTDPAYALVTGKRGQGSFGFWDDEEERAKWMAAEFGVYAFLTRNHVYDGTPDLTADETSTGGDAPLCLVNDRKARISAACKGSSIPASANVFRSNPLVAAPTPAISGAVPEEYANDIIFA